MGAIIDRIRGKAKKTEGRLTGNRVREAEGIGTETKGKVKSAVNRVADKARASVSRAKGKARRSRAKANVKAKASR